MQRKLAADVVGYSALLERDEAGTFGRLKSGRKELIEPEIEKRHGRIFKLMATGCSPNSAVSWTPWNVRRSGGTQCQCSRERAHPGQDRQSQDAVGMEEGRETAQGGQPDSDQDEPSNDRVEQLIRNESGKVGHSKTNRRILIARAMRCLAVAMASAERSMPSTEPEGPTHSPARNATSSRPQPRSSTRMPGPSPARRNTSSVKSRKIKACVSRRLSSLSDIPRA